jgi:adenylate cyclase
MSRALLKKLRQPAPVSVAIAFAVFLAVSTLTATGLLQPVELVAYDTLLQLRPERGWTDERIAVVRITDEDIYRIGHWPMSDDTLAGLLEVILRGGPRVVGLDLYRDLPVPPGTERLEALFRGTESFIGTEKFLAVDGAMVPPPRVLAGTERVGFADLVLDRGGIVRRGLLFLDDGERFAQSMALRVALLYLAADGIGPQPGETDATHLRLGRLTLPPFEDHDGGYVQADARGYQFLLDFRGGRQPFASYTMSELLQGRVPADALRDRMVLVGVSADSVKDIFLTPFSRGSDAATNLPGVFIHAHAASQLLRGALDGERPVQVFPEWLEHLWVLLWSAIGAGLAMRVRSIGRLTLVAPPVWVALLAITAGAFYLGWWLPVVPAAIALFSAPTLVVAYISGFEQQERRFLMEIFARQVSPDVAEELWRERERFLSGGRIEARTQTVTVLFSDLENFTPVAERLAPVELLGWLNDYMEAMAGLVMAHGGVVDDYYGDAIKANFGVPVARTTDAEVAEDARRAVQCAAAMTRELERMNAGWAAQGLPTVRMRAGVCTGPVVAGCIGSAKRMKYTTVGDVVNTAARLESYGKEVVPIDPAIPARVMLAESTVQRLGGAFAVSPVGALALKGKSEPVRVYHLQSTVAPVGV